MACTELLVTADLMVGNSELPVQLHQDRMAVQLKEQSGLVDIPPIKDRATPVDTADGIRETVVMVTAVTLDFAT